MEIVLELRHPAGEKAPVLADRVAAHRRGLRRHVLPEERERRASTSASSQLDALTLSIRPERPCVPCVPGVHARRASRRLMHDPDRRLGDHVEVAVGDHQRHLDDAVALRARGRSFRGRSRSGDRGLGGMLNSRRIGRIFSHIACCARPGGPLPRRRSAPRRKTHGLRVTASAFTSVFRRRTRRHARAAPVARAPARAARGPPSRGGPARLRRSRHAAGAPEGSGLHHHAHALRAAGDDLRRRRAAGTHASAACWARWSRWTGSLAESPLWQDLALIAAVARWGACSRLPFSYWRTFVIEAKFGFNRMTRRALARRPRQGDAARRRARPAARCARALADALGRRHRGGSGSGRSGSASSSCCSRSIRR